MQMMMRYAVGLLMLMLMLILAHMVMLVHMLLLCPICSTHGKP